MRSSKLDKTTRVPGKEPKMHNSQKGWEFCQKMKTEIKYKTSKTKMKQETQSHCDIFRQRGAKKNIEHAPNHFEKEKLIKKILDVDFVGRIQAGGFREL